jgi:hypothetical protein
MYQTVYQTIMVTHNINEIYNLFYYLTDQGLAFESTSRDLSTKKSLLSKIKSQ